MFSWTGTEDKRECASCGRSERLDALKLCLECRKAYDEESAAWEAEERRSDDLAATRRYYNG